MIGKKKGWEHVPAADGAELLLHDVDRVLKLHDVLGDAAVVRLLKVVLDLIRAGKDRNNELAIFDERDQVVDTEVGRDEAQELLHDVDVEFVLPSTYI